MLWQVEVEGERPAAVAAGYGLSPNAMAALARRAREGLRAAYLQAHLAEDTGPRACSSVVAKLGAYTAGGSQGAEQKRIRKHLQTCSSCNALHAELAEVCSTLRAHAASIAVPVAATAFLAPARARPGRGRQGRVAHRTGEVGAASAASVAAVGLLGVLAGTFTGAPGPARGAARSGRRARRARAGAGLDHRDRDRHADQRDAAVHRGPARRAHEDDAGGAVRAGDDHVRRRPSRAAG